MKANNVAIIAAGLAGAANAEGWSAVYTSDVEPTVITTTPSVALYTTSDEATATTTEAAVYSTTESVTYSASVSYSPSVSYSASVSDEWQNWGAVSSSSSSKSTDSAIYSTTKSTGVPVYSTTTKGPIVETTGGWQPVVYDSTTTLTSTVTKTVTVYPTATAPANNWSQWSQTTAPAWSSNGWWGGAWPTPGPGQCVVNVVTGHDEGTWVPNAPAKTTTAVPVYTTSSAVYNTASAPVYSPSAAAAAAFYSAPAVKQASTGNSGTYAMSPNGNSWGMTYSPYTADSGCKDQSTISNDIAKMAAKGFTSVRVYSTDCNTLEYVGNAAKASGIKMILGVFISNTGCAGAAPQVAQIVSWGQWDLVELIVVGNEAIFNGFTTAPELAGFISTSKAAFRAGGYNGPVSTTEDLATWTSVGSQFCGTVDVVSANLYAFFNPDTTADMAGDFISAQIAELNQVCGDKATYVMESGWPKAGKCLGKACPGVPEQATAIKSIQDKVGAKVIFFSYEDELWKQPGEYGVEQHWGCADVFSG